LNQNILWLEYNPSSRIRSKSDPSSLKELSKESVLLTPEYYPTFTMVQFDKSSDAPYAYGAGADGNVFKSKLDNKNNPQKIELLQNKHNYSIYAMVSLRTKQNRSFSGLFGNSFGGLFGDHEDDYLIFGDSAGNI